jgi:phosphoribosyl-AMP cyclohydrolase
MKDTIAKTSQNANKIIRSLRFNDAGLIPVIAQQHDSGEVLMMAWMNAEAIEQTISTGQVCYWSRSRQALWMKGETSGQVQALIDFRWDCDADTILVLVNQTGVACHTGRRNCFFNAIRDGEITSISSVEEDPDILYGSKQVD